MLNHNRSLGQLIEFNGYIYLLIWPWRMLGMIIAQGQRAAASAQTLAGGGTLAVAGCWRDRWRPARDDRAGAPLDPEPAACPPRDIAQGTAGARSWPGVFINVEG